VVESWINISHGESNDEDDDDDDCDGGNNNNNNCKHVIMPFVCSAADWASSAAETLVLHAWTPSGTRHSPPGTDRSVNQMCTVHTRPVQGCTKCPTHLPNHGKRQIVLSYELKTATSTKQIIHKKRSKKKRKSTGWRNVPFSSVQISQRPTLGLFTFSLNLSLRLLLNPDFGLSTHSVTSWDQTSD